MHSFIVLAATLALAAASPISSVFRPQKAAVPPMAVDSVAKMDEKIAVEVLRVPEDQSSKGAISASGLVSDLSEGASVPLSSPVMSPADSIATKGFFDDLVQGVSKLADDVSQGVDSAANTALTEIHKIIHSLEKHLHNTVEGKKPLSAPTPVPAPETMSNIKESETVVAEEKMTITKAQENVPVVEKMSMIEVMPMKKMDTVEKIPEEKISTVEKVVLIEKMPLEKTSLTEKISEENMSMMSKAE